MTQVRTDVTGEIVALFKAGLTMQEVAQRYGVPVLTIEQAIRRWMLVYPEGVPRRQL